MHLKPTDTETLGVEIDGTFLRAAAVSFQNSKLSLDRLIEIQLPETSQEEGNVNPLYMSDEAKVLRTLWEKRLSVSGLSSIETLARRLVIKLTKDKDIDAAFTFQAEPLLPFPLATAVIDKITLFKSEGATHLTLLGARKDHLKEHLDHWNDLDFEPEAVASIPAGLAAFAGTFISSDEIVCVVHLARATTTCVLVKNGKLMASYGSEHGIQNIVSSNYSPEEIASLEQEIRRMVLALKKEMRIKENSLLCFVGEGATLSTLTQRLEKTLQQQMAPLTPPASITAPVNDLLKFATPIGLAISCLTNAENPINFRQEEYSYGSPWKRFMKPLIVYGACCLLLAYAFYHFGESYLTYRLDSVREHYVDLLTTLRKPYMTLEAEYVSKQSGGKITSEEDLLPVEKLNRTDMVNRLEFLQKQLQSLPDTYSLFPNVPLVSDFLAWLSNHPKIKCPGTDASEPCEGNIQLDSLSYTMAKRPDQSKKAEKYQVKVDLEFSAPTPTLAREFHDALIAPNEMVDPKGEVKWSGNRGKYRASFFLKDKLVLPTIPKKEDVTHVQ